MTEFDDILRSKAQAFRFPREKVEKALSTINASGTEVNHCAAQGDIVEIPVCDDNGGVPRQ